MSTAGECMETDVFYCKDSDSAGDALRILVDRRVSGIPVVNDAMEVVGFVNDVEMVNRHAGGYIELGYVIHPDCWGRGYATEMLGAVIGVMSGEGFATVRTGAFSENPASMRVMEKCGMQRIELTEEIEYRGQNHHCIYYEIAL